MIVNSPIFAPAFATYLNPKKLINDKLSERIFKKFINKHGPFDVVHFNNIEGISPNVLRLKRIFPRTKFIITLHNYQPFCPLVQYFKNNKLENCYDFEKGKNCLLCSDQKPGRKEYYNRCKSYLKDFLNNYPWVIKKIYRTIARLVNIFNNNFYKGNNKTSRSKYYENYKINNIKLINKNVDYIFAVSKRVKELSVLNGLNTKKIVVSYIGTKVAEQKAFTSKHAINKSLFTIAFLGYKRIDKGFYFLLNSLKLLPMEISKNLNLVLAVRDIKYSDYQDLEQSLNSILIYNGYNHSNLAKILKGVDLGIIPVLWEDNLPQIAIEFVANGIPILCSSYGGASELSDSILFKFSGGDSKDFISKLSNIFYHRDVIDDFWYSLHPLKTMSQHVDELYKYYGENNE